MSYTDMESKMKYKDCKYDKRFEVNLDQLLFRHYNQNAVFNPELCTKEEVEAYISYMRMYGGGAWYDGIRSESPYYANYLSENDITPLGDEWYNLQNIIRDNVAPRMYNYQDCGFNDVAITYPGINKEYIFINSYISFCESVNAMQSYYNKFKYTDDIQAKIFEIISAIRASMEKVFSGMLKYYDIESVSKLHNMISIDYCAYCIDGTKQYAPSSCFVGGLYIVCKHKRSKPYTCIDGRLTANNIKTLIKSAGLEYTISLGDVLDEHDIDGTPIEFILYDNYDKYGYCVRIISESKSLLTVILRELVKKYNYNGVNNLNKI